MTMSLIQPRDYSKLPKGILIEVHWIGPGEQTVDIGKLLYAFTRIHLVTDDHGKVTQRMLMPQRCGIEPLDSSRGTLHYTNGFQLYDVSPK